MPHFDGPYVAVPRDKNMPGFYIYAVQGKHRHAIGTVPPIGIIPTNQRGRDEVEATAVLFAAAPIMLTALRGVALDKSIDPDLQLLVEHAIEVATRRID